MAPSDKAQRFVNKWGARLIPLILVGMAGYATWVIPVLIGVNRLLNPTNGLPSRTGAGIAIIVIYFVILLPMAASYARTVYIVLTNPSYVPQPLRAQRKKRRRSRTRRSSRQLDVEKASSSETHGQTPSQQVGYLDRSAVYGGRLAPPPGLDQFFSRDVFECEVDGLPRWCSTCQSWKPDRSHHSSEVGRCVYKLDHFCPWAAGIVSETSFKPFLLFCFYGSLYCIFVLIVAAYFTAEQTRLGEFYNVNYIVVIVLSGLFGLFSSGMAGNIMHAVLINSTTIDNLTRRSRTHHFCVLLPSAQQPLSTNSTASANYHRSDATEQRRLPVPTITYPLDSQDTALDQEVRSLPRTFAILPMPTGSNPYNLSSKLENVRTVMGEHFLEWLWPFSSSPCERHAQYDDNFGTVMYKLGPVLSRVTAENGISRRYQHDVPRPENIARRSQQPPMANVTVAPARAAPIAAAREQYAAPGAVTMGRLQEGQGRIR